MVRAAPIPGVGHALLKSRGLTGVVKLADAAAEAAHSGSRLADLGAPSSLDASNPSVGQVADRASSSGSPLPQSATASQLAASADAPYVRDRGGRRRKGEERTPEERLATKQARNKRREQSLQARVRARRPEDMEWITKYLARRSHAQKVRRQKVRARSEAHMHRACIAADASY